MTRDDNNGLWTARFVRGVVDDFSDTRDKAGEPYDYEDTEEMAQRLRPLVRALHTGVYPSGVENYDASTGETTRLDAPSDDDYAYDDAPARSGIQDILDAEPIGGGDWTIFWIALGAALVFIVAGGVL
jgi:hypothetical protein